MITVSDWIGSDQRHFPLRRPAQFDREQAARSAVRGAFGDSVAVAATDFKGLTGRSPNPTQRAALEESARKSVGGIFILESRTGAGKTEAAFGIVAAALRAGASGCYFALPTRATANQIYARSLEFLDRLTGQSAPTPQLLHAGAAKALERMRIEPRDLDPEPTGSWDSSQMEAERWLSGKGRLQSGRSIRCCLLR